MVVVSVPLRGIGSEKRYSTFWISENSGASFPSPCGE